jgi:Zn-dependent peptidase ImmA (M78 family)
VASEIRTVIGELDGLRFEVAPSDDESSWPGLSWLRVNVALNSTIVWAQSGRDMVDEPVNWTWVDFLAGLARSWPWLMLESGYPIPVDPLHPGELQFLAQRRWAALTPEAAEEEEQQLYDYKMCHDLSQFMRGIFLPPLWVVRQGNEYVLSAPKSNVLLWRPAAEVRHTLEQFGDLIAESLAHSKESRAVGALKQWNTREKQVTKRFFPLASGLESEELVEIAGSKGAHAYFEVNDSANDPIVWLETNELLAAARMTAGYVSLVTQRSVIEQIRNYPRVETPQLDKLSLTAPAPEMFGILGYEQGYGLAQWLRSKLEMDEDTAVDCEEIIRNLGVGIESTQFVEVHVLEAVAFWGPHHGPAILLNTAPNARPSTAHGRRTTLAHELCHLVSDRYTALPLVEVIGGQVPRLQEQRARAFAAEFLLPRRIAEKRVKASTDLLTAASELMEEFLVSGEVVMYQINNSSLATRLSRQEKLKLRLWTKT